MPSGTGRRGPRYGRAAVAAVGLLVSFGLWLVPRVVSGASWHTLVTTAASDASGRAWGNNVTGELDDGTTVNRSVPVAMVGIEGASSVAVGDVHGLAITPGGGVVAWGHNRSGQLGEGEGAACARPLRVGAELRLGARARRPAPLVPEDAFRFSTLRPYSLEPRCERITPSLLTIANFGPATRALSRAACSSRHA